MTMLYIYSAKCIPV